MRPNFVNDSFYKDVAIRPIFATYSLILIFMLLGAVGWQRALAAPAYDYGTRNDAALFHFLQGWQQIMDYGQWTESEESFRQALAADPDFIIGRSLVARITNDLDERLGLLDELEAQKETVDADGRLLLDVYLLSVQAMNLRDQGRRPEAGFYEHRRTLSISNFAAFLKKYPTETYIQAEYIESVHAAEGAQAALDSMQEILAPGQKDLPFFLRYRSSLEAELGHHETALAHARQLETLLDNPLLPEPYVLYAEIYHRSGQLQEAKRHIDQAVELDPKHVIAGILQAQIDKEIRP